MKGLVSDIQRFAIHDGPGIRTTVFLKGCPLQCQWCANPETMSPRPEIMFFDDRCMKCGLCVDACPNQAIKIDIHKGLIYDYEWCQGCGECAKSCPRNARVLRGTRMTVTDVLDVVLKDSPYYARSGGGLTISGGEPFMQPEFVGEILAACKEKEIHTVVDTSGYANWPSIERSIDLIDLFLYDLKHADSAKHKTGTGVHNELIKSNLKKLMERGKKVWLRLPLIPGFNSSEEDLELIGDFARQIGGRELRILPYHNYGKGKYQKIKKVYRMGDLPPLEMEDAERARILLERYIPKVSVGG